MQELATVMSNIARLLAIVGGGLSAIAVCYAGILWMTASGDPQKMGQARMALMGAVGGLVIVGVAFIVPRIISQAVIEPVGGTALQNEQGISCDEVLQNQLVFQRAAGTKAHFQTIIRNLQSQRDECSSDLWDPEPVDAAAQEKDTPAVGTVPAVPADVANMCFGQKLADSGGASAKVSDTLVPRSLRVKNAEDGAPRPTSGRDAGNNILVYWHTSTAKRPADGATCWLYVANQRIWSQSY